MNCLQSPNETADGDDLVVRIAERVAEADGVDPMALPPLAEVLDADLLERLLDSADTSVSVGFEYHGHTVVVCGEGEIQLK
ncbi:HalOD1 output domain-containing protein [Halostella salina]|uniref:HalOD1 output domain-containing protein n=1 Tax=Halostella salina TaxID=1547897 RepID=UPI0013CF3A78|nr:HalOD1 output domain-containing protein [Halostella salina]